jgi:hypothetical protein
LSASVLHPPSREVGLPEIEPTEKNWDFGRKVKRFAFPRSSGGFRLVEVRSVTGDPTQGRAIVLLRDEKPKLRVGQSGCLYIITSSDPGESRVPQNLGTGQKLNVGPTISGVHGQPQKYNKDDS